MFFEELFALENDAEPGVSFWFRVGIDQEDAARDRDGDGEDLGGGRGSGDGFVERDDALLGGFLLIGVVGDAFELADEPALLPVGAGFAAAFLLQPALVADDVGIVGVLEQLQGRGGGADDADARGRAAGGGGVEPVVLLFLDEEALLHGFDPLVALAVVFGHDEEGARVVAGHEEAVLFVVRWRHAVGGVVDDVDGALHLALALVREVRQFAQVQHEVALLPVGPSLAPTLF